jgi:large conductance mechanosensitive channel
MLNDFKNFLIKGNAVDMAVGFIFGAAFATVVKSLIANVIMPPIGMAMGKVDFSALKYVLLPSSEGVEEVAISYGAFINDVVGFVILGFIVFMLVKMMKKMQAEEDAKPTPTPGNEVLLAEIVSLLKKKK